MAMSLTAVYERFIASPNPISLAENASLHYIPTLTTHSGSGSIIRHLENQNSKVVKIKSAKTINAIEGQNALAIEVETVLEFVSGGGAYLPKLENFVADKMATLPIVSYGSRFLRCTVLTEVDTHRPVRSGAEDQPDPTHLGSSHAPDASRCHWSSRSELAHH